MSAVLNPQRAKTHRRAVLAPVARPKPVVPEEISKVVTLLYRAANNERFQSFHQNGWLWLEQEATRPASSLFYRYWFATLRKCLANLLDKHGEDFAHAPNVNRRTEAVLSFKEQGILISRMDTVPDHPGCWLVAELGGVRILIMPA